MFGIRKLKNRHLFMMPNFVSPIFNKHISNIKAKIKFDCRIRLANRWMRNNPKRMMYCYCMAAASILLMNFAIDSYESRKHHDSVPAVSSDKSAQNVFAGLSKINMNTEIIKAQVKHYSQKESRLINEFDSIMNIQIKSPEDSARLISIYHILNKQNNLP